MNPVLLAEVGEAVLAILVRLLGPTHPGLADAAAQIAAYVMTLVKGLGDPDAPDPGLVDVDDLDLATKVLLEQMRDKLNQAAEARRFSTLPAGALPPAGAPEMVPPLGMSPPPDDDDQAPRASTPAPEAPAGGGDDNATTTPATPLAKGLAS